MCQGTEIRYRDLVVHILLPLTLGSIHSQPLPSLPPSPHSAGLFPFSDLPRGLLFYTHACLLAHMLPDTKVHSRPVMSPFPQKTRPRSDNRPSCQGMWKKEKQMYRHLKLCTPYKQAHHSSTGLYTFTTGKLGTGQHRASQMPTSGQEHSTGFKSVVTAQLRNF